MARNIVVITGSGRLGGNSDMLAEAFIKGAAAAGHTVEKFAAAADRILGCVGCDTCWKRGKPCSFDDGFDRLAPMLERADAIVLAGPVYWWTFSTILKSAIDKLYAYYGPCAGKRLKIAESALLMSAGDHDPAVFRQSVDTYNSILDACGWTDRGTVLVPGVNKPGEVKETDGPARAEKLGREMFRKGDE